MNTQTTSQAPATSGIHPATHIGHVHLTAANLEKQIAFHRDILGFQVHWREGNQAGLGAGKEDLLRLTELPGAQRPRGTTGLYHTAFLVPNKWQLAQLLKRIADTQTPIQGMSNHHTHLAIYLPDAEGNGIELAWDFPHEQWPSYENFLNHGPEPLDYQSELIPELERQPDGWTGLDPETKVGHVHLHVGQLDAASHFYHDVLGFDTVIRSPAHGMHFVSAGGYHHHVGLNTWRGVGAKPQPEDAIGLRHFSVVLTDNDELQRVVQRVEQAGIESQRTDKGVLLHDPSKNGVLLTTG